MLKEYTKNPLHFPQGARSLLEVIPGLAAVNLFTSCTWTPTEEEEEVARQSCREAIQLALDFAKVAGPELQDEEE
jgi:hypothetical protein